MRPAAAQEVLLANGQGDSLTCNPTGSDLHTGGLAVIVRPAVLPDLLPEAEATAQ